MEPRDYEGAVMTAGPGSLGMAPGQRRRRFDPERNKELLSLAQDIAVLVDARLPEGGDRCRLRAMVELLLES